MTNVVQIYPKRRITPNQSYEGVNAEYEQEQIAMELLSFLTPEQQANPQTLFEFATLLFHTRILQDFCEDFSLTDVAHKMIEDRPDVYAIAEENGFRD